MTHGELFRSFFSPGLAIGRFVSTYIYSLRIDMIKAVYWKESPGATGAQLGCLARAIIAIYCLFRRCGAENAACHPVFMRQLL